MPFHHFSHFLILAASALVDAFESAVIGFFCNPLTTLSKSLSHRIAFMQIFHRTQLSAWSSSIFGKEDSIAYEIIGLSVWFVCRDSFDRVVGCSSVRA